MNTKTLRAIGAALLVAVWLGLTAFSWLGSPKEYSDTERRPLAQAPALTVEALWDGSFMTDFEDYTLDQFPLREDFRTLKALTHFYGLQQSDKDGLYIAQGYLADMDHAPSDEALARAVKVWQSTYERLLQGKTDNIYFSVIPDKNYYLSQSSHHLGLDVAALEQSLAEQLPWVRGLDIKHTLSLDSYYRTDTHWRQEAIVPTAQVLLEGMGMTADRAYTPRPLETPFYGVYYGQVAVPTQPDSLVVLENETLLGCTVTGYVTGGPKPLSLYGEGIPAAQKDPYNLFLHGSEQSVVVIENPNAATDRELVLFRDSFGCSIAPLLVADYARVTVVDLRVVNPFSLLSLENRGVFSLQDADVLFLYSSLVINNPDSFQAG